HLTKKSELGSYGQFCPVAMAAEIVCSRWTALLLREMLYGSTRFNDLRRGVPRMSPALLSKRLKELEQAGVIAVMPAAQPGAVDYKLSDAGGVWRGVIMSLGIGGQRWVESPFSLKNLDPAFLMWDMRRNLKPMALPDRRCTVEFIYPEVDRGRRYWWLVIEDGTVDLCGVDPGYDVDLHVRSSLRSMTAVWMGHSTLQRVVAASLEPIIQRCVGPSPKLAFKAALATQPGKTTCARSRNDRPRRLDLAILDDF